MKKDCWFKKPTESNTAISSLKIEVQDEWDVGASFVIKEEELTLIMKNVKIED
jgi:hypothetical protein